MDFHIRLWNGWHFYWEVLLQKYPTGAQLRDIQIDMELDEMLEEGD